MEGQNESTVTQTNDGFPSEERSGTMGRKQFLKVMRVAALTTFLLAACSKNSMTGISGTTAHLGSNVTSKTTFDFTANGQICPIFRLSNLLIT